jgi:L-lysine exporter family protein LysE/ArgO
MSNTAVSALLSGFGLGAGFIVAIGAQNAYVLRQGLRRRHVGLIVVLCAGFDILLIGLGVAGMGAVIQKNPVVLDLIRYFGAAFLFFYGCRAFLAAYKGGGHLDAAASEDTSAWTTAVTVLALSALNPHVYLDTVVLLGSIGGRLAWPARAWFAAGAMLASALWFTMLGFGARALDTLFQRESAWRVLDGFIGIVMFTIAGSLLFAR